MGNNLFRDSGRQGRWDTIIGWLFLLALVGFGAYYNLVLH